MCWEQMCRLTGQGHLGPAILHGTWTTYIDTHIRSLERLENSATGLKEALRREFCQGCQGGQV
jgi:hypothetical protein